MKGDISYITCGGREEKCDEIDPKIIFQWVVVAFWARLSDGLRCGLVHRINWQSVFGSSFKRWKRGAHLEDSSAPAIRRSSISIWWWPTLQLSLPFIGGAWVGIG